MTRVVGRSHHDWPAGGLPSHERRVRSLDALATLIGCRETLGPCLPDGLRPDVLRIDSRRGALFIGDAKDTESPGNRATQARLQTYLRWLAAHAASGRGSGIFAIGFGRGADAPGWVETATLLGREARLRYVAQGVDRFDADLLVAWFRAARAG